ncbi:hypothetical protein [Paenibacillus elgii]|uniref:hypothetical protein n=1 Tax=Paenibacillus elgii TaxID=189691 RepID=UPI0013D7A68D|nr:hypothetical protein [Paenibacillus elgii]
MKIRCECGGIIVDQTDSLPYKGHLISDQDWFDFLDAIDRAIEKSGPTEKDKERAAMSIRRMAVHLTKLIYQCTSCGLLYVTNEEEELETFQKSEPFEEKSILASAHGGNWKQPLIGSWDDSRKGSFKGNLWCTGLEEGEGDFDSWERLEGKYYDMLLDLKKRNLLRSAHLKKNNEIIHQFPFKEE